VASEATQKMAIRFVDATYLALSQISFLVTDLSKKNYKSSMAEIQNVSSGIGRGIVNVNDNNGINIVPKLNV
jgi:hypothetical protein